MLTFGLFGLPTSMIAVVIAGLVAKTGDKDLASTLGAVLLAVCFFAQWIFIAWSMFARTRRPSDAPIPDNPHDPQLHHPAKVRFPPGR